MTSKLKAAAKVIILLVVLFTMLTWVNEILIKKVGHRAKLYQGLYNEDSDYDVLLLGSSHMHGLINPNVLWSESGITSFNYGTGGQPIDVTYYLLLEALKNNPKPKLVVLDLYYLGLTNEYGEEGYIRYVIDNMKFSKNKINAVLNCTPREQWISYLFPIVKYHSRWKELTEEDFAYDYSINEYAKGFNSGTNEYGLDNTTGYNSGAIGEIPEKTEKYLYKFIELSKEIGFELIFINAPYDYSSNDNMDTWYKDDEAMFNKVAEIAEENNIPFINYSNVEKLEEINFIFSEDMNNIGHANIWGADKVSYDFTSFIKDNYELTDKRNESSYVEWNEDSKYYFDNKPVRNN